VPYKLQPGHYKSTKALGVLIRDENLSLPDPNEGESVVASAKRARSLTDPLSQRLQDHLEAQLGIRPSSTSSSSEVQSIFKRYASELQYIAVAHTLSEVGGKALSEAEIVMGTILGTSSRKRERKAKVYRMYTHAEALVKGVGRDLRGTGDDGFDHRLRLINRAWKAWELSQELGGKFGANSFGLIALGVLFDCLDG